MKKSVYIISSPLSVVGLNHHQEQSNLNTTVWAHSSHKLFKWLRSDGLEFQKGDKITVKQQLQDNPSLMNRVDNRKYWKYSPVLKLVQMWFTQIDKVKDNKQQI